MTPCTCPTADDRLDWPHEVGCALMSSRSFMAEVEPCEQSHARGSTHYHTLRPRKIAATPDPRPLSALLALMKVRLDIIRPDLEPEMADTDEATFYLPVGMVRDAIAAERALDATPAPLGDLMERRDRLIGRIDFLLDLDATARAVVCRVVDEAFDPLLASTTAPLDVDPGIAAIAGHVCGQCGRRSNHATPAPLDVERLTRAAAYAEESAFYGLSTRELAAAIAAAYAEEPS